MKRLLTAGAALAALASLLIVFGQAIGLDQPAYSLFGLAVGGSLASLPANRVWRPVAGFTLGFAAAWLAYALRAGALPDTHTGHAVASVAALIVVTLVATLIRSQVMFSCALLGIAALVGAYETTFGASPDHFTAQSVEAATTVLLATALGYLGTTLAGLIAVPADSLRDTKTDDESATSSPTATEKA